MDNRAPVYASSGARFAAPSKVQLRRPQFIAPLVLFPSLFLAVNVGGLSADHAPGQRRGAGQGTRPDLGDVPHVHGFLDFQLAGALDAVTAARRRRHRHRDRAGRSSSASSTGSSTAPIPRGRPRPRPPRAPACVVAAFQVVYFLLLGPAVRRAHRRRFSRRARRPQAIGALAGVGFGRDLGQAIALRARYRRPSKGSFRSCSSCCSSPFGVLPRPLLSVARGRARRLQPAQLHRRWHAQPHHRLDRNAKLGAGKGWGPRHWRSPWPRSGSHSVALRGRLRDA